MLLAAEAPDVPEPLRILRQLRLYAGKNGSLPFIEAGGYYDQPFWFSELLECTLRAEQEFYALMELQNAAQPQPQ